MSTDWWPLSDGDPVPGDPGTLAALGRHLTDAAAEIERMATTLPRICTSQTWDSDAGQRFRVKAASTGSAIGRTHRRFFTVARALGASTYGGDGYAARLQEHQDRAAAALAAVNGTAVTAGSETRRLQAWAALLAATSGADPALPLATTPAPSGSAAVLAAPPLPPARPGVIPPYLTAFPDDPAAVAGLKNSYNAAIDQLSAAARTVAAAAADQAADAHAAAEQILTAIDSDGLNNPSGFLHWADSVTDDVRGFVASHWVRFVADLANVAGVIASVCGIIALVLAFIPGMQAFAAAFETVALLAQAAAFACHLLLLATGHGSLLDVLVDAVGLITFGVGKGLIGGAEATAEMSVTASSAYQAVVREGAESIGSLIKASDSAVESLQATEKWTLMSKGIEQLKEVVSVRPVFGAAVRAFKAGTFGESLGENAAGTLWRGLVSASGMSSPEIGSALSEAAAAGDAMPYAQGVAWAVTSQIEGYQQLFRIAQGTGLAADGISKLDATLSYYHHELVGYDALKSALPHGDDG